MIYFASDLHLGTPDFAASLEREKKFVRWLDAIAADAQAIYLVGDLFDYWFEYKTVVPRGFIRLLGKLAQLRDAGIEIYAFTGNHDLWMRDYFEQELQIPVYRQPIVREIGGKTFFIGHGDGLGPGDYGYKIMKKLFINPLCQWSFRQLHPDLSMRVASYFSRRSRAAQEKREPDKFEAKEKEWLFLYAQRKLQQQHIDYFIFGHRHLPLNLQLTPQSQYINLGDWIKYYTYATFNGETAQLLTFNH